MHHVSRTDQIRIFLLLRLQHWLPAPSVRAGRQALVLGVMSAAVGLSCMEWISRHWLGASAPWFMPPMGASAVLLFMCLLMLWLELRVRGKARHVRIGQGVARRAKPIRLGGWSLLGQFSCLLLAVLVSACQTTPRAGSETRAQVTDLPAQREQLRGGYRHLHPALRAGVTRADFEAGRLVQGDCAEPDATQPQGRRWVGVTVLLPAGTAIAAQSVIEVDTTGQGGRHRHGRFVGAGPALNGTTGFVPWPGTDRRAAWCRASDAATGGEAQQKTPEVMQRCAQCGVHVPLGESTQSRGRVFCSEAHRDNWFRDNPQP